MMRLTATIIVFALAAGNGVNAQSLKNYELEAEQTLQRLRQVMMQEMQTAMQGGVKQAIGVCRHLAPEIEEQIEKETGWQIRRIGLRVRNPDNKPDTLERSMMMSFELRAMAGQSPEMLRSARLLDRDGTQTVHFMQAIPTFDTCPACHGKQIAPEVTTAINELYPQDQAIGYEVGDIRGAFSLYKVFDPAKAAEAKNGSSDWDRIAALELPPAVELEETGRTGNAVRGRDLFAKHCRNCHSPAHLAKQYFGGDEASVQGSVCVKLQSHGTTDEARDCDLVAFLKALAVAGNDQ
jgi:hypothetical protein